MTRSTLVGHIRVGKTNLAILNGDMDLSTWSEEELIRGQRRAHTGRFTGRPPKVVPMAVHNELVRRRLSKAADLLNESVVDAVLLLRQVVTDEEANYGDRIKAAQLIVERVMGKTPERIELTMEPPWAMALRAAMGGPVRSPNGTVDAIDAVAHEVG
jgi:hypothetical protein